MFKGLWIIAALLISSSSVTTSFGQISLYSHFGGNRVQLGSATTYTYPNNGGWSSTPHFGSFTYYGNGTIGRTYCGPASRFESFQNSRQDWYGSGLILSAAPDTSTSQGYYYGHRSGR